MTISLIRQPVRDNKCLILAGTTENIHRLNGKMEIYVTPEVVKHYYASLKENHITLEDLETHNIHCIHENHNHLMEENLTEEPEEEDCHTDSEGKEEQKQNPEKPKEHPNSQ